MITVNENGIAQIKAILAKNHRLRGDHFTPDMLRAWAQDVEISGGYLELRAWDHVDRIVEMFCITDEGFDET